jgi:hypothetical protein
MIQLTAETPTASTVPEPFGKPSGPGLWHVKGMMLPAYIQHVAHDLLNSGAAKSVSQAIQMAVGIVRKWSKGIPVGGETKVGGGKTGKHPGKIHPDVQAAAVKAMAEWDAKRARAHAQHAAHEHSVRRFDGWGSVVDLATVPSPTAATRKAALKRGAALPHPSGSPGKARFPMTNRTLASRAVKMVQLAKGDKTAIRRHIMAVCRKNGWADLIPDNWNADGTTSGGD